MAKLVYYSGEVQGVGFRMTVASIARRYPVAGWVRNLPDGRVQLLAEGPEAAVEAFLLAVRERWKHHVETEEIEDRQPTGTLRGFEIVG
ncbi:MAG TPA: acylphosphatase [Gemmataceae bacterium]|nr:acylphosphatase [Gemmataceae bacterium]